MLLLRTIIFILVLGHFIGNNTVYRKFQFIACRTLYFEGRLNFNKNNNRTDISQKRHFIERKFH